MLLRFMMLIVLCYVSFFQAAIAESMFTLTDQLGKLKLSPNLAVMEDPERALSIQQVISSPYASQFKSNEQKIPNFGRTESAYWARFTLNNQSNLKWYMRISAPLGPDVELTVVDNEGHIVTDKIASALPDYGFYAWSLELPKQKDLRFFVRATNGNAIFRLPIELFASDEFAKQTRIDHNAYAGLIASLLVMAAYNLLSFLWLRETSYLSLGIHIASVAALIQFNRPVFASLSFLNDTEAHFFTVPFYLVPISLLVFCRQLLRSKENTLKLDWLMRAVIYISTGLIFVSGWLPQGVLIAQLPIFIAFILIITTSIFRSLQGDRIATYFLFIFLLVILIVVPNAVISAFFNTQWQGSNMYTVGIATLLFTLLLSIVQAERVRQWREEKQKATLTKEAADNFLMTISHELRTPMQTLISVGELLQNTALDKSQKSYLYKQERASEHMLELVNDMLDLGAMAQGKQSLSLSNEPFYLQNLLEDLKNMFSVPAEQQGLRLIIPAIPVSSPPVSGDIKHLKQVLVNLLGNAIKFTKKGSVTLIINLPKDPQSTMPVSFEVSDTGIGIPVEQQSHLFEPFVQINDSTQPRSGSGLGLAISYQLVKQMGGELQLKSQTRGGSCFFFTLRLPIHTGELIALSESRHKGIAPLQNMSILLVEDDLLNQFFGQKLLMLQGADVQVASSGQEVIHQVQGQSYDFILMDLNLPDMRGSEVVQAIRALSSIANTTIIALSAHAIGQERENCLAAGMDDYLAKPYKIDELTNIILKHKRLA